MKPDPASSPRQRSTVSRSTPASAAIVEVPAAPRAGKASRTRAQSAGCHRIIRDWGATCVTRAEDIIEMLSPLGTTLAAAATPPSRGPGPVAATASATSRDELDTDSARVLDALPARGAAGTSTIAAEAGVDLDTVLRCLGLLAGSGFIERCDRGWHLRRRL